MFCHIFKRNKRDKSQSKSDSQNTCLTDTKPPKSPPPLQQDERFPFDIVSTQQKQTPKSRSGNWWFSENILSFKDFHYVLSSIDKCLKHISDSSINIKTNPPYLPGILRNFHHKILDIFKSYESNLRELSSITFFRVTIWTLIKQLKEIVRLVRHRSDSTSSEFKRKLINISILLSHLFHALVALFPNSTYSPETFRITKSDAADWWHSQFGPGTTVVEWNDFFHLFSKTNYISEVAHIAALRRTINVTGNGFVSIFDFDVFVRLFQPWSNILESWRVIVLEHPGCLSLVTYEQVVQLLRRLQRYPGPGSYVFRFSCTKPGQWAIGYIDFSGKIYQTIVHNKSLAIALCEGEQAGIYKFPNGVLYDTATLRSLASLPLQNIAVSPEQHEAYCRIDSSFEVCKICAQYNKNIKLEPCGHLLCNFCLVKWQKSFRCQSCPFCRLEIKGIEKVSLIPFVNEIPSIPPRISSDQHHTIDPDDDLNGDNHRSVLLSSDDTLTTDKINYAQLEWMSINDSGYCVNSTFEIDNPNNNNTNTAGTSNPTDIANRVLESDLSLSSSISPQRELSIDSDNITSDRAYFNVPSSSSIQPIDGNNNHHRHNHNQIHITTHDSPISIQSPSTEAMKQLLKITKNDVTMSQEILRYFTPRSSLSICSNS